MKSGLFLRNLALFGGYALILAGALWLSLQLRFDFQPSPYLERFFPSLLLLLAVCLPCLWLFGQFRSLLSFFSLPDAQRIVFASGTAHLILLTVWYVAGVDLAPPRAVILLNFLLSSMGLGAMRLSLRLIRERSRKFPLGSATRKRLGIFGAGTAGAALVEEFLAHPNLRMDVVAIFDDDGKRSGSSLHGIPVLGGLSVLRQRAVDLALDELILATPNRNPQVTRTIIQQCRRLKLPVRTIPTLHHLMAGQLHLDRIKPVELEDLLARDSIELEAPATRRWIEGKRVMVTGAGGTIGAELARQVWACHPKSLILIERSEPALFEIEQELKSEGCGKEMVAVVADIGDPVCLPVLLKQHQPDLILHAAAHKHVPLMEQQPGEALANNARKTLNLAQMAANHGVREFVMISTDKAINPTNVMGASKRVAEIGLQLLHKVSPAMKITSVRFGNVLGSSGSVIPTFRRQIAAGGPVTVTHPEVTRYFMSVAEAAGLVLTAGRLGKGGEIFVLDMGEPVKIEAMARQLIELSGFEPGREIEIRYTGLRPGEKLYEELSHNEEVTEKTEHPKIWRLKPQNGPAGCLDSLEKAIQASIEEAAKGNTVAAKQKLKELVPEYAPWLG
jgi:FlaA1/EpsC-like NDP-sugar epimerase